MYAVGTINVVKDPGSVRYICVLYTCNRVPHTIDSIYRFFFTDFNCRIHEDTCVGPLRNIDYRLYVSK